MKMYNDELINLIVYNTFKCFMYFYVFTRCNNRVAGGECHSLSEVCLPGDQLSVLLLYNAEHFSIRP